MITPRTRPFSDTRLVHYLDRQITKLSARKTQADIARQAGFAQPTMMANLRNGSNRLPLDRVPGLAKALECDPAYLFGMAVEQHSKSLALVLEEIYGTHVTRNEVAWLAAIREASKHTDPTLTVKARKAIGGIFGR